MSKLSRFLGDRYITTEATGLKSGFLEVIFGNFYDGCVCGVCVSKCERCICKVCASVCPGVFKLERMEIW